MMIVLEASATMDAADVAPTRLGRARQKVHDLAAARPGARTGLIVYAGTAHLVLPPTEDVAVLTTFADAISTMLMPVAGDDAAAALAEAEKILALDPTPGSIVFVTDGIDAASRPPLLAAADRGEHELLVMAVGTERGGALTTADGRIRTDGSGTPITARLDAAGLRELEAGGIFVTSQTLDDSDIERIGGRAQSHLERVRQARGDRWSDAGVLLMWPVLLLLLPWFRRGWSIRWRRLSAAAGMLAATLLALPAATTVQALQETPSATPVPEAAAETPAGGFIDLWLTRDQQGRRLFERGDFAAAARTFEDPMWRGVAAYRADDFPGALQAFALVQAPDGDFNLGNTYARLRDWERAIAAYDRVLEAQPGRADAAANRALVAALRDAEAEEQPPPPSGDAAPPTFDADEVAFDNEEDQGSEGEVEMSVLTDEQIAEMWLRQLTTSPAQFLRGKFAIQAANREAANTAAEQ